MNCQSNSSLDKREEQGADLAGAVSKIFESFNQVRDEAESMAFKVVKQIEKDNIFGANIVNISGLVESIFSKFDQVVNEAEKVGHQIVKGLVNIKVDINKAQKRDASEALVNQTANFAKNVANLTQKLELVEFFNGIIKPVNKILEKIAANIDNSKMMNSHIDEDISESKRDVGNSSSQTEFNQTTSAPQPQQDAEKDKEAEKYKKIGDFYRNKYAAKYMKTTTESVPVKRDLKERDQFYERYRQAGKHFAQELKNITVELIRNQTLTDN